MVRLGGAFENDLVIARLDKLSRNEDVRRICPMTRIEYGLWWVVSVLLWLLGDLAGLYVGHEARASEMHDGWTFVGFCVLVWATYRKFMTDWTKRKRRKAAAPRQPDVIGVQTVRTSPPETHSSNTVARRRQRRRQRRRTPSFLQGPR